MLRQGNYFLDDSWVDELFQWADNNNIPELHYIEENYKNDSSLPFDHGFWVGLPRDKETLLNLEELNLSWHSCTEIPEQIRHLTKLRVLRFAKSPDGVQPRFYKKADKHSYISNISYWLSDLENLEELDLSGNNISCIPSSLGQLKKLESLYLHGNRISCISDAPSKLEDLQILWIQWNCFTSPGICLRKLKSLKKLWCDGVVGAHYGPIEICPEGVRWPTNDGYMTKSINHKGFSPDQHQAMSLVEIIETMNLLK